MRSFLVRVGTASKFTTGAATTLTSSGLFARASASSWILLVSLMVSLIATNTRTAAGATIHVTTLEQKISSSGGCSLEEAIYSSVLRDSFDDVHGIAIDTTDPDHFIQTECALGTGNDLIILPGGVFHIGGYLGTDAHNPYGPTATPIISSTITIEANGATFEGSGLVRLFAVGPASYTTPHRTVSGTGSLRLRYAYVKGFRVKGGDGGPGGGGGMGAGAAIYVQDGHLTVANCTFEKNSAQGGDGGQGYGGGGGGIYGNGGGAAPLYASLSGGGGGGGAKGNGGNGDYGANVGSDSGGGGGGGGTVYSALDATGDVGGAGGGYCGGRGGNSGDSGQSGACIGGGGGGGGYDDSANFGLGAHGDGGTGGYGGGGGGGDNGGKGGFGGGGGAVIEKFGRFGGTGGQGGFGGGGGASPSGLSIPTAGPFGGYPNDHKRGGGGAGLGGAIFADSGTVVIDNSTFVQNEAKGGAGNGGSGKGNGAGGAIFSRDGSLTVRNATLDHNCGGNSTDCHSGGIVVFGDKATSFTVNNSIINNKAGTTLSGANDCLLYGQVDATGAANIVTDNTTDGLATPLPDVCPGVVSSNNPGLGSLQDNGGVTPTMAITKVSAAYSTGDGTTALPKDQRGLSRPSPDRHGYDIGAFEACTSTPISPLDDPCAAPPTIKDPAEPGTAQELTVASTDGGIVTPAPGKYSEPWNKVVLLSATPNDGYYFRNWTGGIANDPSSAANAVIMDRTRFVQANFQLHNFHLELIPSTLGIPLGYSGSIGVIAYAEGDFADAIDLSTSGIPSGVKSAFSKRSLAPTVATPQSSVLTLTIGASVTPRIFVAYVTGTSGALTRLAPLTVTVVATAAAVANVVSQDQALGCIDNLGVSQSLIGQLKAVQAQIDAHRTQPAVNTLGAFQLEVQAQEGQHIATICRDGNNQFYTAQTLIADAQALQASVGPQLVASPIVGRVVNASNEGVAGATINLIGPSKTVIATATTDAVGFYYFADTTALTVGGSYTATVALPKDSKSSTPKSDLFQWRGRSVKLPDLVLN